MKPSKLISAPHMLTVIPIFLLLIALALDSGTFFAFGFENKKVAGVNVRIGLTTKHPENNDFCDKLVAVFRRLTCNPSYDTSAEALVLYTIFFSKDCPGRGFAHLGSFAISFVCLLLPITTNHCPNHYDQGKNSALKF